MPTAQNIDSLNICLEYLRILVYTVFKCLLNSKMIVSVYRLNEKINMPNHYSITGIKTVQNTSFSRENFNIFYRQCLSILRSKIWLLILFCIIAVSVTVLRTLIQKPSYTAVAKIVVAPKNVSWNVTAPQYFSHQYLIHFYVTQYVLLHNRDLLDSLIDEMDLRLHLSPNKRYRIPQEIALNILQRTLRITYHENANILEVRVTMKNRFLATEVANNFVETFKRGRQTFRQERIDLTIKELEKKIEQAKVKLDKSEKTLEDLKREQNLNFYAGENIDKDQLLVFNHLYLDTKINRMQEEIKLEKIKELPSDIQSNVVAMQSNHIGFNDIDKDNIIILKHLLANEKIRLAKLRQHYGENYPEIRETVLKINEITEKIQQETEGLLRGLEIKYEVIKNREENLLATIKQARERLYDIESSELLYLQAKQEMLSDQENYIFLNKQYVKHLSLLEMPEETVEVIEKARVPLESEYVRPYLFTNLDFSNMKNLFISLIMMLRFNSIVASAISSLFIGFILVLVYGFYEKEVFDKARQTAFSVVSVIPTQVGKINELPRESVKYESFRVIATRLDMVRKKKNSKTILITSNGAAEGRSLTTVNISYALGDMGKRVLVVDANLRKPDLPELFEIIAPELGLRNIADFKDNYKQLIVPIVYNNVDLLPAGTAATGNDRELDIHQMQSLIDSLKPYYDFIIFDGPPLLGFADSLLLAGIVDEILVIVAHKMYPQMTKDNIERYLATSGGNLMGIIINNVSPANDIYKTYYHLAYK